MQLQSNLWSQALLYCHGPRWEYRRDKDDPYTAIYIPTRVLPLVRPGKDMIILPGNCPEVEEFAEFCMRVLDIDRRQIFYTSGSSYQIQTDARRELVSHIKREMRTSTQLMPYSVSSSIVHLGRALGIPVVGDSPSWVRRFGTKAILHPNAIPAMRPAHLPYVQEHVQGIARARGYLAMNREELDVACEYLAQDDVERVLLKPADGSTGEGITPALTAHGANGYAFPLGPVLVEEELEIDRDCEGRIVAPSIQYVVDDLGNATDQLMSGLSHCGNRFPSMSGSDFVTEFRSMAGKIIEWAKPRGLGGFDALSVKGKPILVDVNAGRWTGAHPALLFKSIYAPNSFAVSCKVKAKESVAEVWGMLQSRGLAFDPKRSTKGIFPLCHLSGMWAMHVAIGETPEQAERLAEEAQHL